MTLNILGALTFGYNPSACLLQDGELIAFAQEERFVRIKNAFNHFPINAIKFCLQKAQLTLDDVDYLAIPWDCKKYPDFMKQFFQAGQQKYGDKGIPTRQWEDSILKVFNPENFEKRIVDNLRENEFYGKIPKIVYVEHHITHAANAFFPSEFDKAAILTLDGSGEEKCSVIWKGSGNNIEPLQEFLIPNSLGWFYATITQLLGFKSNLNEGKVMGLAPYGKKNSDLFNKIDRIISFNDNGYEIDPFYTYYGTHEIGKGYSDQITNLFGKPRGRYEPLTEYHHDLAFAAQSKLEEVAIDLANKALSMVGTENICLSGGVCLNCKMNGEIFDKSSAKNIFIQPISSDAGSPIGAALWLQRELTGQRPRFRMKHAYYGPGFNNDQIEEKLKAGKLSYQYHENIEQITADLLADGNLIGWVQGGMEGGARALGARSILADPTKEFIKDKVNAEVKKRELWRPFCPSVTEEAMGDYFINPYDAPYMILAFQVIPDQIKKIQAVVHVDGSARPQSVSKETNPRYWNMIKHFEANTGVPIVLNTSFNVQGEPIICKPEDAIRSFYSTGLDALVIGNYLLQK